jgi:putative addiction module killer protein
VIGSTLSKIALLAPASKCVDRLVHGNPGQHRNLTDGVSELKIDFGPGYRVYYTERGGELVVLLAGGDKSTQQQDIKSAIALARNL